MHDSARQSVGMHYPAVKRSKVKVTRSFKYAAGMNIHVDRTANVTSCDDVCRLKLIVLAVTAVFSMQYVFTRKIGDCSRERTRRDIRLICWQWQH